MLEERANTKTKYGGKLSVRKAQDEKPLIMFGHDECIFKQYTMTNKSWKAPNGAVVLIPKDDVQGVMISAFQSREFRLGLQLNQEQLALINQIREFEYGQNSDGYWSYEHMVLQREDCIDVMKVFHPEVDVLLLFDHSCSHDRQREDGLNVENMSKGYGGKQSKLRPSIIKQADGYLGLFNQRLNEGSVQMMVFCPTDDGPFWMNTVEREAKRKDVEISNKMTIRKYTKEELIRKLLEKGGNGTGNMKNLQRLC
jgi:hypothetical protein